LQVQGEPLLLLRLQVVVVGGASARAGRDASNGAGVLPAVCGLLLLREGIGVLLPAAERAGVDKIAREYRTARVHEAVRLLARIGSRCALQASQQVPQSLSSAMAAGLHCVDSYAESACGFSGRKPLEIAQLHDRSVPV